VSEEATETARKILVLRETHREATSFAAANEVVKKLVMTGILKEMTGQRRNRSFRYDPYIGFLRSLYILLYILIVVA